MALVITHTIRNAAYNKKALFVKPTQKSYWVFEQSRHIATGRRYQPLCIWPHERSITSRWWRKWRAVSRDRTGAPGMRKVMNDEW